MQIFLTRRLESERSIFLLDDQSDFNACNKRVSIAIVWPFSNETGCKSCQCWNCHYVRYNSVKHWLPQWNNFPWATREILKCMVAFVYGKFACDRPSNGSIVVLGKSFKNDILWGVFQGWCFCNHLGSSFQKASKFKLKFAIATHASVF